MCELMCMSFAKPVVANVSIQAFSQRSQDNADGWGLAWYPDRSLAMVKQPMRWSVQHTHFLENYPGLLSSIYVAHVRQRTTGSTPTHADTHPFARELNGREYCFAHNGTLSGEFWQKPLGRFRPVGGTDSEFVFCLLLAELERFAPLVREVEQARKLGRLAKGQIEKTDGAVESSRPSPLGQTAIYRLDQVDGRLESPQQWQWLYQLLLQLNDFGRLNCILTDGERLLVYHDKNGWKNLTYRNVYLHQDTEHHFGDATVAVNLQAQPVNHGVIVATNPLSVEGWEHFLPGEMKILHEGNIVFSRRPGLHEGQGTVKAPPGAVRVAPIAAESQVVLNGGKAATKS
jgi:predicted glutamine amidotransferase